MKKAEKTAGRLSQEIKAKDLRAELKAKQQAELEEFIKVVNEACRKYKCGFVSQTVITGNQVQQSVISVNNNE